MKVFLSLLSTGILVFSLVSLAKYSQGSVVLYGFGYEIEISMVLFVFMQLALAILFYYAIRIFGFLRTARARLRRYFVLRKERKDIAFLRRGTKQLIAGETKSLLKDMEKTFAETNNVDVDRLLIAARAAHDEFQFSLRDDFIARALTQGEDVVWVAKANMLLDEGRYNDALMSIANVKKKTVGSLRLEAAALAEAEDWKKVLMLLKEIRRSDALEQKEILKLEIDAFVGLLSSSDVTTDSIKEVVKQTSNQVRMNELANLALSRAYFKTGDRRRATEQAERYLDRQWDEALFSFYIEICNKNSSQPLEKVEAWLELQPRNSSILFALGKLCLDRELWGKSEGYLRASIALESSGEALTMLEIVERKKQAL